MGFGGTAATLKATADAHQKISTGKNEVCLRGPQMTGSKFLTAGYDNKITQ